MAAEIWADFLEPASYELLDYRYHSNLPFTAETRRRGGAEENAENAKT